jgi:hypothetical protein
VGQSFGFGEIVDGNELEVWILQGCAENVAPDPSKSIDTYFDCHFSSINL